MATQTAGIRVIGEWEDAYKDLLTPEALAFIGQLEEKFGPRRRELLQKRQERQTQLQAGKPFDFLKETEDIRNGQWTIAPLPADLLDRRVEITGPVDRKMIINALNSGAKVFMADFEDATAPVWSNLMDGQVNLRDAIRRTIRLEQADGKVYKLNPKPAVLKVRPRGWHLEEKHVLLHDERISASLFDFGLYFFHNARTLIENGSGPYFYLPKLESRLEARLWNDVFIFAQKELGIPNGTIKATVLIETIPAAFEMDEILYELKEHSAGLNCGRWDYIFSYLKKHRSQSNVILPDRVQVTMTSPFMRAYSLLAIKTCHKRNAPAIGGMAAQIPIKDNPEANEAAMNKVKADKLREASDGHDGTWVAHPALVTVAMDVFNEYMPGKNQIEKQLDEMEVTAADLLEVPDGTITEAGLRMNIDVGIRYLASWLSGRGAAPIHHLMEDAATAEISRAQVWQWIRHDKGILDDGRPVTMELYDQLKREETAKIAEELGDKFYAQMKFPEAADVFDELVKNDEFTDFLTLPIYEKI
ncbi:malate synthase A [Metabacillus sp. KIGAM252]|uniref:Malate synthase n=1 Tax=Metabacillus flavus TaxID=2823519 RepID=A0ABS5LC31_9BACI|nr:malate synthase A [Metabacillus flavus]